MEVFCDDGALCSSPTVSTKIKEEGVMDVVSSTNNQATALACSLTNVHITVVTSDSPPLVPRARGGDVSHTMYVSYVIAQCAVNDPFPSSVFM